MRALRRERVWFVCMRLKHGGWTPLDKANFPRRRDALALRDELVRRGWAGSEIDVCGGEAVIEQKPQVNRHAP